MSILNQGGGKREVGADYGRGRYASMRPSAAKAVGIDRLNRSGKPLRHPKSQAQAALWHPGEAWQGFDDVVVDNGHGKKHEKHERGLIDAFFDGQADFLPHEAFDE